MPISRSQMPRQMYGLGSFVKSIGKGIKKIVKSPIGKAAILGFGANALIPGGLSSLFSGGGGLTGLFTKAKGLYDGLSGVQKLGGALALGGAFGGMEDQQIEELKSNPEALANYLRQYYSNLNQDATPTQVEEFVQRNMQADGGRMNYANGMDPLPYISENGVRSLDIENLTDAQKQFLKNMKEIQDRQQESLMKKFKKLREGMPENERNMKPVPIRKIGPEGISGMANGGRINRAYGSDELVEQASGIEGLDININPKGVKELDLRETGGFIPPVGVKEKADDIPAMLSNNEFVFTADAVRAAGGGSVNKGAQIMYDTMKKLENGGTV